MGVGKKGSLLLEYSVICVEGWIHSTVGEGARSSSSTAFLNPALESRENIDLLLHTQVTRLLPTEAHDVDFRTVEISLGANGLYSALPRSVL